MYYIPPPKTPEEQFKELQDRLAWTISNWSRALENMRLRKDAAEKKLQQAQLKSSRYDWIRDNLDLNVLLNEKNNGETFEIKQGDELDVAVDDQLEIIRIRKELLEEERLRLKALKKAKRLVKPT